MHGRNVVDEKTNDKRDAITKPHLGTIKWCRPLLLLENVVKKDKERKPKKEENTEVKRNVAEQYKAFPRRV